MNKVKNNVEESQYKMEVVSCIERTEKDVYRVVKKEKDGKRFVDLRIFYTPNGSDGPFIPQVKGVMIPEEFCAKVIIGLLYARNFSTPELPEGEEVVSEVVCEIPFSDEDILRVSKGRGKQNVFVDLRRCYRDKASSEFQATRKGVSILESSLDGVIEGLQKAEFKIVSSAT